MRILGKWCQCNFQLFHRYRRCNCVHRRTDRNCLYIGHHHIAIHMCCTAMMRLLEIDSGSSHLWDEEKTVFVKVSRSKMTIYADKIIKKTSTASHRIDAQKGDVEVTTHLLYSLINVFLSQCYFNCQGLLLIQMPLNTSSNHWKLLKNHRQKQSSKKRNETEIFLWFFLVFSNYFKSLTMNYRV